jgi:NADP-dependent 3-hydroxy acid dehydrogenase YdfG
MIFITGASSGIGTACAERFAAEKRNLILCARRIDRLDALASNLTKRFGVEIHTIQLDVCQKNQVFNMAHRHRALLERVDVLINNAGLALGLEPLQNGNPDQWDQMIDTNVKGLLYVTRAISPLLIAKGHGHIVNIGSVAGHWVYPNGNVYVATKHAVRALNEAMRLDFHGTGVRVTTVDPGMVETEFSQVRLGDVQAAKRVYEGMTPLSGADIADAVYYACSRPAHINIQEMVIFPTDQASVGMVKRTVK